MAIKEPCRAQRKQQGNQNPSSEGRQRQITAQQTCPKSPPKSQMQLMKDCARDVLTDKPGRLSVGKEQEG